MKLIHLLDTDDDFKGIVYFFNPKNLVTICKSPPVNKGDTWSLDIVLDNGNDYCTQYQTEPELDRVLTRVLREIDQETSP